MASDFMCYVRAVIKKNLNNYGSVHNLEILVVRKGMIYLLHMNTQSVSGNTSRSIISKRFINVDLYLSLTVLFYILLEQIFANF